MDNQSISKYTAPERIRYPNLDAAKFVMALLVILIHARPFEGTAPIADFLVSDVAARVAVPIFFAISGFLLFRRLEYENGKVKWCAANRMHLMHYLKRNVLIYFAWSGVYIVFRLPYWYKIGWWGMSAVKNCVASLFFSGSYYHTWFLLSLIYAVPLLFGILTICPKKKLPLIITIGWFYECLMYSYAWLVPQFPQPVEWLIVRIPIAFDTFFRALPLLGIGVMLSDHDSNDQGKAPGILCLCAMAACAAEAIGLKLFSPNQTYFSYLIFTPHMTYLSLRYLIENRQIGISPGAAAVLREASLIIYCLHPMVIQIFTGLGMESGVCRSLAVMALSTAISVSWPLLRRMRR